MIEPRELTLYHAGELIRRGQLTSEDLVRSCLARIEAREPAVRAWAGLYAEQALETARARDREASGHRWQGPLHGVPLGIKDIFDVQGMETRAGTRAYTPRLATTDAVSVACLREAGAIFLGKTVTTAFAMGDPGETRNPWNPAHTPGGSSSGSGAAVADRMCMAALGTQTAGSVIRPASYNGLVGFKPSFGAISTQGVIPLAWQLDHVGTLTRSVEDAHLLWHLLRQKRALDWQVTRDKLPPPLLPRRPNRVWRVREVFESEADPEMADAMEHTCRELARHGVTLVERPLPPGFKAVFENHQILMASEAATVHKASFQADPDLYPPRISALIREGLAIQATEYVTALRCRQRLMGEMAAALEDVDAALMPAATGPAPEGLDSTGDRRFNAPSSMVGFPVVSFPVGLSSRGLPLGVQLLGRAGGEEPLFCVAGWCESVLDFPPQP